MNLWFTKIDSIISLSKLTSNQQTTKVLYLKLSAKFLYNNITFLLRASGHKTYIDNAFHIDN
jgi:hypothetical protein